MTLRSFVQPDEAHGTVGRVRDLAREQRARRGELIENPPTEGVVGGEPFGGAAPPVGWPCRHLGEVQPEIRHRAHHDEDRLGGRVLAAVLEQRAILLERLLQLGRVVGVTEAAPRNEVGRGRHHGGGVELQERQVLDDTEQVLWSSRVEQLRLDGDPACVTAAEPLHRARHNEPRC